MAAPTRMIEPAQKSFVERFMVGLYQENIEKRLRKFDAISRHFDFGSLSAVTNEEPYFRHYLGFRMATWRGEGSFWRLNDLLRMAERQEGWSEEFDANWTKGRLQHDRYLSLGSKPIYPIERMFIS